MRSKGGKSSVARSDGEVVFSLSRFRNRSRLIGEAMKSIHTLLAVSSLTIGISRAESTAVLKTDTVPKNGITQVWSPLFQATWDKFNTRRQGKLIKVEPKNDIMSAMDRFTWNETEVMPTGGYAVFAGPSTAEFATEVRNKVLKQFRYHMTIGQPPENDRGETLYGVLVRDLNFKQQFYRSRKHPMDFKDSAGKTHQVSFFGTAGKLSNDYGSNVRVLSYDQQKQSFILSVTTDKTGERLIIYRPENPISFNTAFAHINKARKSPLNGATGSLTDGFLHKYDMVKIPYLNIDVSTDFTDQLQGLRHYSQEPEPWIITKAVQITKFELFEKGARVRVETRMDAEPFGGEPPKPPKITYIPRQFICDRPFFVFIWKDKATLPYFATWASSSDITKPFKK